MEEDPLFWQSFYGNASERHANLYYDKAAQSFNMEKNKWTNQREVEGEAENLRIASNYFNARSNEERQSTDFDPNDQKKFSFVKSLVVKGLQLTLVIMNLEITQLSSKANRSFAEAQTLANEMKNDANKLVQDVSHIYDEAKNSMTGIDDAFKNAEDIVRSLEKSNPAQEIERFIKKDRDPLEFRWDTVPLLAHWLPPDNQKLSKNLGTRREEADLWQMLKRANKIGLYGPIGSGKTTLLLRLWNNQEITRIFPDGKIWIEAARCSLEEIPGIIASALGETLARSGPLIIQATEIFHLLNGKKAIIVLDGATSREEVAFVMKCVPQSCTLLVSSSSIRCLQILNGETVALGSLELPESVSLLRAWYGAAKPNQILDDAMEQDICRKLACLPLAIELVGRYIRQSGSELQQVYDFLQSLQPNAITAGNRALHQALALCITRLSDHTVALLKKLSGMGIKYFSQDILQAVHQSYEQISLPRLLELGVIRSDQSEEFYLVPLLPVVLNNRLHQDVLQGRSGLRMLDFLQTYFSTNAGDYQQLEKVRHLFFWVIEHALKYEFANKITELVRLAIPFLMNAGYWSTLSRTLAVGLECSELTGNLELQNLFSYHIALLHYHNGHEELAVDLLQERLDSFRKHEDWYLLLMALYMIGKVFEAKEQFEQAAGFYQEALDLPTIELITQIHVAYHLGKVEKLSNDPESAKKANQLALNAIRQFALFSQIDHKKGS